MSLFYLLYKQVARQLKNMWVIKLKKTVQKGTYRLYNSMSISIIRTLGSVDAQYALAHTAKRRSSRGKIYHPLCLRAEIKSPSCMWCFIAYCVTHVSGRQTVNNTWRKEGCIRLCYDLRILSAYKAAYSRGGYKCLCTVIHQSVPQCGLWALILL